MHSLWARKIFLRITFSEVVLWGFKDSRVQGFWWGKIIRILSCAKYLVILLILSSTKDSHTFYILRFF
jgi:hypothetical protein